MQGQQHRCRTRPSETARQRCKTGFRADARHARMVRREPSDAQTAAVANYVTKQFGNPRPTLSAEQVGSLRAVPQ